VVGVNILPKSSTFTANLAKSFLKILMPPLQFVELAQRPDPLRIWRFTHHLFERRDAKA